MKHLCKKTIAFAVMLIICVFASLTAHSFDSIESKKNILLTIETEINNSAISDVDFKIYHVADITAQNSYRLTEEFEDYPISLENLDTDGWRALAQTLTYYAQADDILPTDKSVADNSGIVKFPSSEPAMDDGLYLVSAEPENKGQYTYFSEPFLISLQSEDVTTKESRYTHKIRAKGVKVDNITPPITDKDEPQTSPILTTERNVVKIWKDDTEELRPDTITVELLKNGTPYERVLIDAQQNWRYSWENLPEYDESGSKIEWGIVERGDNDYTVSVYCEENTFVLTNTYNSDDTPEIIIPAEEPPLPGEQTTSRDTPTLPQTGVPWWPVFVCVACGLLFIILGKAFKGGKK